MHYDYPYLTLPFAAFAILLCVIPASAGDRLSFPPPVVQGKTVPKMTMVGVQQELDKRLKSRFDAAAGPGGKLTAQTARAAGWGFVADHFSAIDKSGEGSVTLDQIQNYMSVRSPLAPALAAAAAAKKAEGKERTKPTEYGPIQIIE
jgi:hypothetical protein